MNVKAGKVPDVDDAFAALVSVVDAEEVAVEVFRPAVADPVPNEDFGGDLDEEEAAGFVGLEANEKGDDEAVVFAATVSADLVPNMNGIDEAVVVSAGLVPNDGTTK